MLRSTFANLREYLTPVSHTSSFKQTGQLTPEEFVQAGDYLVYRFPTWSWAPAANKSCRRDFLPEDKQVLVTKHVPCLKRANNDVAADLKPVENDEAWMVEVEAEHNPADLNGATGGASTPHGSQQPEAKQTKAEEVPPDLELLESMGIQEQTDFTDNSTERSYNVYITYSTSYRVPKAYLSGFDANGAPLAPKDMFEDVVGDYMQKTVTIEQAPFDSSLTLISIHPCRHAGVMRMLLDMADRRAMEEASESASQGDDAWEEIPATSRVDQYLIVFLKFIASVTPTIEYDFTMTAL